MRKVELLNTNGYRNIANDNSMPTERVYVRSTHLRKLPTPQSLQERERRRRTHISHKSRCHRRIDQFSSILLIFAEYFSKKNRGKNRN